MLSAIIVAAGQSTRAGFDKLFAQMDGRAVVNYSLEAFSAAESVGEIVLVCHPEKIDELWEVRGGEGKLKAIVAGGARRQDSVAAGLEVVSAAGDFVAVHDAARPLITAAEIERVYAAARSSGAAVLAAPLTDTLKVANSRHEIAGSIDRTNVFAMQTPQIFARELLRDAYARVMGEGLAITDEVSAVQHAGARVVIVPAEQNNMKITFAGDLTLAEMILKARSPL